MRKSRLLALLAAAVCCVSVCSCTEKEIILDNNFTRIKFSWWGKEERNSAFIQGLAVFSELNEDISVEPEYSEYSGYKSKMDVDFYSDSEADVVMLNYAWLSEYSPDGNGFYDLYTLTDYIDLSNFSEQELEYGTINGKLNGLPASMNAVTLFYNKTIYDSYGLEIPQSWEDWFAAAQVMSKDNVYPVALTSKNIWFCCVAYARQVTGRDMFNEDGSFAYTQQDIELMLEFYLRLINEKVCPKGEDFSNELFNSGKAAGVALWISDANTNLETVINEGNEIAIRSCPVAEGASSLGWYLKASSYFAIKSDTENPAAAARLMDFLFNSPDMSAIKGTTLGIPVSRSALETLESRDMLDGIQYEAYKDIVLDGKLEKMNVRLENDSVIEGFTEACNNVYYEQTSISQAAEEFLSGL